MTPGTHKHRSRRTGASIWRLFLCVLALGCCHANCVTPAHADDADAGQSADRCDDTVFLRRASVVLTGRVPAGEYLKMAFSEEPLDRAAVVDRLLDSDEFASAWSRWMSAFQGCEELPLSTAAFAMKVPRERVFWLWQEWTRQKLTEDTPYSDIVSELIASDSRGPKETRDAYFASHQHFVKELKDDFGSATFLDRNQNDLFWKTNRTAEQNAEYIARNLLGYRLECAKCHDHPYAEWTMDDHQSFCAVLQRTVYAELPLTRAEKTSLLFQVALGGGAILLCLMVACWLLYRRGRRSWAALPYMIAACGCATAVYAGLHFQHLLFGGVSGVDEAPARILAGLSRSSQHVAIGVAVTSLTSLFWLARTLVRADMSRVFLCGHFSLTTGIVVVGLLATETCCISAYPEQPSFVSLAKSRLLNDTRAQQSDDFVREVYDDTNGNYRRLGTPRLLNGPSIPETATAQPRQRLAHWLVTEQGEQLQRSFINRVALRVFGTAFVMPVDDFLPGCEVTDPAFLEQLTADFDKHHQSVKWLLKSMVLSDRFQIAAPMDSSRIEFQPRTLRAEEIVASLNQLPGADICLNARWTATPANPFSCGSEAPRNADLADRMINTGMRSEESSDMPAGLVAILMVDETFQEVTQQIADQMSQEESSQEQAIRTLCRALWTTDPDPRMTAELIRAEHDFSTAAWAIINNHRFLVVD